MFLSRPLRLVVSVVMLCAALPAFAQSDTTAPSQEPSAPPLVEAPPPSVSDSYLPPRDSAPSARSWGAEHVNESALLVRGPRIVVELIAGGLAGGLLGFTGAAIGCSIDRGPGSFGCLDGLVVGALVGDFTGILAGTVLAGYVFEGNGSVAAAAVGELLGGAAGTLLLAGLATSSANSGWAATTGVLGFLALPIVGAAVGYELSSDLRRSTASYGISILPTIAPTSRGNGALVGVRGGF